MNFWNDDIEKQFFIEALKNFATPEQLFYKVNSNYLAYIPNSANVHNQTLQSRNSLIGKFTEKWTRDFFEPIAKKLGLYAVNGVVCDTLSLTNKSSADLAFCTNNSTYQYYHLYRLRDNEKYHLFTKKESTINDIAFGL